jgi:hypothetical protein
MDNYLQEGIMAVKAGDKARAFELLRHASQVPATSEQAWLWLSAVVSDDPERLFCLNNVLRINSDNQAAKRGASSLRQKGIFPAMPDYPEPPRAAPTQEYTPRHLPASKSSETNSVAPMWAQTESAPVAASKPQQQPGYETDWKKQELAGFFQYAAMELESNRPHQAVEKLLVGRGATLEVARTVVKDAQYAVRKIRREKYKKRMTRGFLSTMVGIVITCGTYAFAANMGGKFILFYGVIIAGLIDFAIGLIGWIVNI